MLKKAALPFLLSNKILPAILTLIGFASNSSSVLSFASSLQAKIEWVRSNFSPHGYTPKSSSFLSFSLLANS